MSAVIDVQETEQELITTAQLALSSCNWTVGDCAAKWTSRYSRGRTDADFGALVGLSGDQIYQRRRVWECFADVTDNYSKLKWSHFYVALTWSDSAECLGWADENQATVAEMKAWRRMQNGEDLTVESESELDINSSAAGFGEPVVHLTPEGFGNSDGGRSTSDSLDESHASGNRINAVAGDADSTNGEQPYAPFRTGAGSVPSESSEGAVDPDGPAMLNAEQAFKKITTAIERCTRMLTDGIVGGFADIPEKDRIRFLTAVENFNEKTNGLS
ncbi:MAG: hypothetical protein O3B13_11320 [Planctomycetota bacterium]|nr:hypothetical protein [Planctomycetota bacterium]MDA1163681.1 hypothetical protein [Planctomycetota bacterium]